MRLLTKEEMTVVAGGDDPADLGEIVVVGPRRMTDDQIRDILQHYYNDQDGYSGGGLHGGGGGGAPNVPPPVVHVQEEDSDGDGQIDTLWIDNDGDGQIGVGDGAAFLENGPWSNLSDFQTNSMMEGLKGWMLEKGFEVAAILGGSAVGSTATGETMMKATIRAGSGLLGFAELSWMSHQVMMATLGGIDFAETNEIQASGYSNYFGTYNPYTGGSGPSTPGNGGGGGGGGSGGGGFGGIGETETQY